MDSRQFLINLMNVCSKIFETKEEMFLLGYITACGGEKLILDRFEGVLKFLEETKSHELLPIMIDVLEVCKKLHEDRLKEAKSLLVKLTEERKRKTPLQTK